MPGGEVTFYSGGCAIAGTFTEATDPVAAALLVPGGGKSDRNSDARLPPRPRLSRAAGLPPCGPRAGRRGSSQAHYQLDQNPLGRVAAPGSTKP